MQLLVKKRRKPGFPVTNRREVQKEWSELIFKVRFGISMEFPTRIHPVPSKNVIYVDFWVVYPVYVLIVWVYPIGLEKDERTNFVRERYMQGRVDASKNHVNLKLYAYS